MERKTDPLCDQLRQVIIDRATAQIETANDFATRSGFESQLNALLAYGRALSYYDTLAAIPRCPPSLQVDIAEAQARVQARFNALIQPVFDACAKSPSPSPSLSPPSQEESPSDCSRFHPVEFTKGMRECDDWFRTVIGLEEPKKQLQNAFLNPLRYPKLYNNISRGILNYGLPGTGKTLVVRAAVNELQKDPTIRVLFHAPTAAELKGKYFGESEKAIAGVFRCASQHACQRTTNGIQAISIVFLDEIEGIAGDRAKGDQFATTTVNALLQAMDGIGSFPNVAVIANTNFPWSLDPAIQRRFSQSIYFELPSVNDINRLLSVAISKHLAKLREPATSFLQFCEKREDPVQAKSTERCPEFVLVDSLWKDVPFNSLVLNLDEIQLYKLAEDLEKLKFSNSDLSRLHDAAMALVADEAIQNNAFVSFSFPEQLEEENKTEAELLREEKAEQEKPICAQLTYEERTRKTLYVSVASFTPSDLRTQWNDYYGYMRDWLVNGESVRPPVSIAYLAPPEFLGIQYNGLYYVNSKLLPMIAIDNANVANLYFPKDLAVSDRYFSGDVQRREIPVLVEFTFLLKQSVDLLESEASQAALQVLAGRLNSMSELETRLYPHLLARRDAASLVQELARLRLPGGRREEHVWIPGKIPVVGGESKGGLMEFVKGVAWKILPTSIGRGLGGAEIKSAIATMLSSSTQAISVWGQDLATSTARTYPISKATVNALLNPNSNQKEFLITGAANSIFSPAFSLSSVTDLKMEKKEGGVARFVVEEFRLDHLVSFFEFPNLTQEARDWLARQDIQFQKASGGSSILRMQEVLTFAAMPGIDKVCQRCICAWFARFKQSFQPGIEKNFMNFNITVQRYRDAQNQGMRSSIRKADFDLLQQYNKSPQTFDIDTARKEQQQQAK